MPIGYGSVTVHGMQEVRLSVNRKVCSLESLLQLRADARAAGKTVVHCHGCFDIVHPGHIAYLQFAKSQGDILLVSLTADPLVNKGLNRPFIPEDLRAGSLAALECVDWVYVNPHPTAVELLEALRPDVYVKGREYEINNDPRFLAERQAVSGHGGRVVFSSGEVIYSSTSLIGAIAQPERFHDEKVRRFRQQYDVSNAELLRLVNAYRGRRVVVIGDYILDRYHFCDATSVASEGPMMTLRQQRSEEYDGGAAVIALHLAGLGASPVLVTSLAADGASKQVESRLRGRGVEVRCLHHRRQLVAKNRYVVDQSKLLKVDEGSAAPLDSQSEMDLAGEIEAAAEGADALIFADFGYGVLTARLIDRVLPGLRQRVPIVTADVSGQQSNLLRFGDVDLLCPTEREVRQTLNDFGSGLNAVVWNLLHATGARQAIITLGKQGLIAFDQHRTGRVDESWERRLRGEYLPSLCGQAVDPLGCGDAMLATASLTLAAGGSLHAAAYLGSAAAAVEAGQIGNHPVTAEQVLSQLGQGAGAVTRLAS